jgi:hypothetical protein
MNMRNINNEVKLIEIPNDNVSNLENKKLKGLFLEISSNASLKETLNTYTKLELDTIRRTLELSGISALKKAPLIDVLSQQIAKKLPQIIKKLSFKEYKLLQSIICNGGILKFDAKLAEILISIRKYGLIIPLRTTNGNRYLLIPQELRPDLSILLPKYNNGLFIPKEKIGRNSLCPCGSGKKYKKCCLNLSLLKVV